MSRCTRPLQAYRGKLNENGKHSIVWKAREALPNAEIALPCGQCTDCRLERSRQWAMRCVHESELYDRNCFITLTYDEVNIPDDGCVSGRELQLFMKRLRKAYSDDRIRFFACGEYGESFGRPHYHACLFNFDFSDKYLWSVKNDNRCYRSPSLEKIWGKGMCLIGDVTFDSAAYVARYIMKKVTGDSADDHYVDRDSGFIRSVEFVRMSRRPGIASDWFKRYKSDIFPSDVAVMRGVKMRPPKFYDGLYEIENPDEFVELKRKRVANIKHLTSLVDRLAGHSDFTFDNTPDRLVVKEFVKKAKIKSLIRPMEGL